MWPSSACVAWDDECLASGLSSRRTAAVLVAGVVGVGDAASASSVMTAHGDSGSDHGGTPEWSAALGRLETASVLLDPSGEPALFGLLDSSKCQCWMLLVWLGDFKFPRAAR